MHALLHCGPRLPHLSSSQRILPQAGRSVLPSTAYCLVLRTRATWLAQRHRKPSRHPHSPPFLRWQLATGKNAPRHATPRHTHHTTPHHTTPEDRTAQACGEALALPRVLHTPPCRLRPAGGAAAAASRGAPLGRWARPPSLEHHHQAPPQLLRTPQAPQPRRNRRNTPYLASLLAATTGNKQAAGQLPVQALATTTWPLDCFEGPHPLGAPHTEQRPTPLPFPLPLPLPPSPPPPSAHHSPTPLHTRAQGRAAGAGLGAGRKNFAKHGSSPRCSLTPAARRRPSPGSSP